MDTRKRIRRVVSNKDVKHKNKERIYSKARLNRSKRNIKTREMQRNGGGKEMRADMYG